MKNRSLNHICLLIMMTVLAVLNCTRQQSGPEYIRDGKVYGQTSGAFFSHRWWNFYERGVSYAEGRFYQEAIDDLQEAILQREEDQRMARAYGMHFIDYFPHRELGVVHFQMGNFDAAKEELELSLGQFPSAKARYYLDQVRQRIIEGAGIEVGPPILSVIVESDVIWTREDPVQISGVAEDENYVSGIVIHGIPLLLEGSQKQIAFEKELDLNQGRHDVVVGAANLMGKVANRRLTIHVDRQGPIIVLNMSQFDHDAPEPKVTIQGSIHDRAGVAGLMINDQEIPIHGGVDISFKHILYPDTDSLVFMAEDTLGNRTSSRIPLLNSLAGHNPVLLASADSDLDNYLLAALFEPKDTDTPRINLKGWTDAQTVFLEKVYIEGYVSDTGNIVSFSINKVPVLHGEGRLIFFSHFAALKEGENSILFEVTDKAGNTATKEIIVIRKVPAALQIAERLCLTVLPFSQKGDVSESSYSFQDYLIDSLIHRNRFRLVERNLIESVLNEQKLSRTSLIEKSTALQVGKLVAAQSIITGNIIETREGIEIVSRMIDTETSEILATVDVYNEGKSLASFKSMAQGMAIKFHREFPLLNGLVVQKKGKYIFIDVGGANIKLNRRVLVYRESPLFHPVTSKVIGTDNEIIERARIVQVGPDISKAELMRKKDGSVKLFDKVITE